VRPGNGASADVCLHTPPAQGAQGEARMGSAAMIAQSSRLGGRSFSSDITDVARSAFLCADSPVVCICSCERSSRSLFSNRLKSVVYLFAQNSFLLPRAARRTRITCSKSLISNRNNRRLETYLTPAKSTRTTFLIATNSHIADSLFLERRFGRHSGTNSNEPARRRRYQGPELRGGRESLT
jgi:hypothetical protein